MNQLPLRAVDFGPKQSVDLIYVRGNSVFKSKLQYINLYPVTLESHMKTQLEGYEIKLIDGIAGNGRNEKPAFRHIARGCAMTEIRYPTRDR